MDTVVCRGHSLLLLSCPSKLRSVSDAGLHTNCDTGAWSGAQVYSIWPKRADETARSLQPVFLRKLK